MKVGKIERAAVVVVTFVLMLVMSAKPALMGAVTETTAAELMVEKI